MYWVMRGLFIACVAFGIGLIAMDIYVVSKGGWSMFSGGDPRPFPNVIVAVPEKQRE